MSDNLKIGDLVRVRETNDEGEPLFVGESDLTSCVGWAFVVVDVAQYPLEYPLFCRVHPLYTSMAPKSIRNGISLKHEEVELISE